MLSALRSRITALVAPSALVLATIAGCAERAPTAPEPSLARARTVQRINIEIPLDVTFSCGTFEVSAVGAVTIDETVFYDASGRLTRAQAHLTRRATLTNLSTGASFEDRASWSEQYDATALTVAVSGKLYVLQGATHVRDVGRFVLDLQTGEILFQAGPKDTRAVPVLDPLACAELAS